MTQVFCNDAIYYMVWLLKYKQTYIFHIASCVWEIEMNLV